MLRLTLAALHLLALGIGLGAVWARARSLGARPLDADAVRRAFVADSWWGIAALLWIASGVWRLLAGTEKATSYYTHDWIFLTKMLLFALVFALEIRPMITLMRWRSALAREPERWQPDERSARRMSQISYIEAALLVGMVVAAVSMARGYGYRGN
jgi:putative membrane protein